MFFIDIYVKTDGAWNKVNVKSGSKIKYMSQDIESGGDTLLQFTIDGDTFQAENGTRWIDWVDSEYAYQHDSSKYTMWFTEDSEYIHLENNVGDVYILCNLDGSYVGVNDIIITNTSYNLTLYRSFEQ